MVFSPANIPTILKANDAVKGIIGSSPCRCYPLKLPSTPTLPACTYQKIGNTRLRGFGMSVEDWQVDCWAVTFSASYALSQAVWNALTSYTGIISGVRIEDVKPFNEVSTYEDASGYYRHMLEFRTVTIG